MREETFIRMISNLHHRSSVQLNKLFEADAEIIRQDDGFLAISVDGFSEFEDFFQNTPPGRIGHNMIASAISDLLACGVKPEFIVQNWDVDSSKGDDFYKCVALGVENVLHHYGAFCLGGDTGSASPWRYAATVFGRTKNKPVTRVTSRRVQFDLYLSGKLGDANLAGFTSEPMPKIELREPVPLNALFATDTSGGFFDALENFRRVNTGMSLKIEFTDVISDIVLEKWPKKMNPVFTLIGGIGEYELIFAMPRNLRGTVDAIRVGEGEFTGRIENDFLFDIRGKTVGSMKAAPPDYRNISPENYLEATKLYFLEVMTL